MKIVSKAFSNPDFIDLMNLKTLFKSICNALKESNKELWDEGFNVLKTLYINIEDSVENVVSNLKDLRKV